MISLTFIKAIERTQKSVIKRHKIIIDDSLINNNKSKKNAVCKKYNDELDYFFIHLKNKKIILFS